MKRFNWTIAVIAVTSAISVGCCTGGRQSTCDEEDRVPGMFTSREAPRGEVAVALPGVLRSTPAVRSRDEDFPTRTRAASTSVGPDSAQDRDLETDRLAVVEKKVSLLTDLLEALNKKVNDKCK